MCRKLMFLVAVVSLLCVADFAFGYARWRNSLGDQDFSKPGNWTDNDSLYDGRMVINRGPSNPDNPTDPPIMSYTPDPCYTPTNLRGPGYDTNTAAEWYITGGFMHVGGTWQLCYNSNTTGFTEMTGGELIFDGNIQCPRGDNSTATVHLHGGIIRAASMEFKAGGLFDIRDGGTLILEGDKRSEVAAWISAGYITGTTVYEYVGGKTVIRGISPFALLPRPNHRATGVDPHAVLSWKAGEFATSHDVYFGSDFNDVNDADTTVTLNVYRGNQALDANSYDPPGTLVLGEIYYWRIDEVNEANIVSPWKGDVWWFTVDAGKGRNASPAHGAWSVPVDANLSWTPGVLATSHDVYFGADWDDVNDGTGGTFMGNQALDANSYNPGPLDSYAPYYWRIDENGTGTYVKGDVWRFTTVGGVLMYYKFDGPLGGSVADAIADSTGSVIFEKYTADSGSLKYGGTNPNVNATGTSAKFSSPAGLYRLDTGTGDILDLSSPGYTIEMWIKPDSFPDYESYALIRKYRSSYVIYLEDDGSIHWFQNGDYGDEGEASSLPDSIVPGNWYHIAAVFDSADPCEPQKLYVNKQKVAGGGTQALNPHDDDDPVGIGHMIRPNLDHDDYYNGLIDELRISDTALDPPAFLYGELSIPYAWQPNPRDGADRVPVDTELNWRPGVSTDSHDVYFGTDSNDVNDADTTITFDVYMGNQGLDANTYDPCGLDYLTTYYWRIDEVDDGNTWKGEVWSFTTRTEILDPNLIVWFKFEETSGNSAYDSSGHYNNGDVRKDDQWDPNGYSGRCLRFYDDNRIDMPNEPNSVFSDINEAITISAWLNGGSSGDWDNYLFDAGDNDFYLRAAVPDDDDEVYFRAGFDGEEVRWLDSDAADWYGSWSHYAFVKDSDAAIMRIYHNGELVAEKTSANDSLAGIRNVSLRIGSRLDRAYEYKGKVDEFKIYKVALSEEEIGAMVKLTFAWDPSPGDRSTDVPWDVVLSWRAGDFATSHDVYFGTGSADVGDANTTSSEYKGNQALVANSYDPCDLDPGGLLELGETYYWRIDEVNDACDASPWTGNVWSFTVADYVHVDDFESYVSTYDINDALVYIVPDPPPGSPNGTWIDGWMNYTGSQIYLVTAPNELPVRTATGRKSMDYWYDNTMTMGGYYYYSEVELPVSENDEDWTAGGAKALSLWFHGDPCNDAEQMYVALGDGSKEAVVKYDGDVNDVKKDNWQEWNVDLKYFKQPIQTPANDVNLTSVDSLYIGFGDREHPEYGGSGIFSFVGFDDIRLYRPRCVPSHRSADLAAVDFSGDCLVYLEDLDRMTSDWLEAGLGWVYASAPDANKLVLQYLFDETDGNTVFDETINAYDGTVFDDVNQSPAEMSTRMDAGKSGNSFHFSAPLGNMGISVPNDVFADNGISQEITIGVWIKNAYPAETPDSGAFMWEFRQWDGVSTTGGARVLAVETDDRNGRFTFRDDDDTVRQSIDWANHTDWVHYAFVRDANNLTIYVDGLRAARDNTSGNVMAVPGLLYVGISADRAPDNTDGLHDGFTGNMDDFRIYSCALPYSEVIGLAEQASVFDVVDSTADLNEDNAVNFKDCAILMDWWLEEEAWPAE